LKIIGAVGQIGSGKDTVIRYISNRLSILTISIGDIAREIARNEGLPETRENLQKITQKRYEQFGRTYFIEETIRKIKYTNIDRILITGIRAPTDVATLRKNFHDNFLLICVTANKKTRFQRLARRAEPRDPKTWKEFLSQDEAEEEIFQVTEACKLADLRIENNGTAEELFQNIDKIIKEKLTHQ
jgi:dephospho-CoA kinase